MYFQVFGGVGLWEEGSFYFFGDLSYRAWIQRYPFLFTFSSVYPFFFRVENIQEMENDDFSH